MARKNNRSKRRSGGVSTRKFKDNPNYRLMTVIDKNGRKVRRYVKVNDKGDIIDKRYKKIGKKVVEKKNNKPVSESSDKEVTKGKFAA